MKSIPTWLAVAVALLAFNGCARVEKVRAIEGDKEVPYDSLGTLEVKQKAYRVNPSAAFWTGVEIATLTFADTPSRGEHYKKFLRRKLQKLAGKRYDADAVINVKYWPNPESGNFPDGYIYARGEMIQYHHFPKEPTQSSLSANTKIQPEQRIPSIPPGTMRVSPKMKNPPPLRTFMNTPKTRKA